MNAQTRPRRRSSFNFSAMISASRRCSSICRPSPSCRSNARSSRRISKACSIWAGLSGNLLNVQGLLKPGACIRKCHSHGRLPSGLPEIAHSLFVQLAMDGMMGEPLYVLTKAIGIEPFHRGKDARVDVAPPLAQHSAVGYVVCERMLESVLQFRKELCCIKKLGILQIAEQAAELVLRETTYCV